MAQCNPGNNNLVVANPVITLEKGTSLAESELLSNVQASVLNGAVMTADMSSLDVNTVGDYKVLISASNAVTAPAQVSVVDTVAPVLSVANVTLNYSIASVPDEATFLASVQPSSNEADATITSDFATVVAGKGAGVYQVAVTAVDGSDNVSLPVYVQVTLKAVPVISTQALAIEYQLGTVKSEAEFYADLAAVVDDGSLLVSNFAAVDFATAGSYQVVLNATDSLGGAAASVQVMVTITAPAAETTANNGSSSDTVSTILPATGQHNLLFGLIGMMFLLVSFIVGRKLMR